MVIVECSKDEALIKRLGFSRDHVRHEYGKSKVLGRLNSIKKGIGIVDEDPQAGQPSILKEYIPHGGVEGSIKFLKKKDDETKQIIQISPYLEDWLLELAKRNKIDPENYSISTDPKEFHGLIVRGNNEFQRFLQDLIKTNDEEVIALKKWIMDAIE